MFHGLKAQERGVRIVAGRLSVSGGTPAVVDGDGFSLVDVGAGQVRVTLADKSKAILAALAIVEESTDATAHMVKVKQLDVSAGTVDFNIYVADATDGALVDNVGIHFMIVCKDTRL